MSGDMLELCWRYMSGEMLEVFLLVSMDFSPKSADLLEICWRFAGDVLEMSGYMLSK